MLHRDMDGSLVSIVARLGLQAAHGDRELLQRGESAPTAPHTVHALAANAPFAPPRVAVHTLVEGEPGEAIVSFKTNTRPHG